MSHKSETLTVKQRAAIAALLACQTVAEAAKQAAVGQQSIYRWLRQGTFRFHLRRARHQALSEAFRRLQQALDRGVDTPDTILGDEKSYRRLSLLVWGPSAPFWRRPSSESGKARTPLRLVPTASVADASYSQNPRMSLPRRKRHRSEPGGPPPGRATLPPKLLEKSQLVIMYVSYGGSARSSLRKRNSRRSSRPNAYLLRLTNGQPDGRPSRILAWRIPYRFPRSRVLR